MNSKYREQTCCFVGHKDIPPGEQLKILARVEHRLIPLIQQGVTYFGVGGSLGFDALMADMLVSLKLHIPGFVSLKYCLLRDTVLNGA